MSRWSPEKAWRWYNARPWIRGCNFMSSDCVNRIDQWQEFGFEEKLLTTEREIALCEEIGYNAVRIILEFEVWDRQHDGFMRRLDRYLDVLAKHHIGAMVVLANDCSVPREFWKPAVFGEQPYDIGYHGGRKHSPHGHHNELSWHLLDDPDTAQRYYRFVQEIMSRYAHDDRVIVWNLFNEPGNNRASLSLPHMEKLFEIGWALDPIQPLCADVWRGVEDGGRAKSEIEQRALDLSDIISYHNYGDYDYNIATVEQLRLLGRPMINTEWLHRITHNTVFELYPLFYLEKIGCFNWGFVAGKYQTYEPWNALWEQLEAGGGKALDITKWQHDLFRPGGVHPYDPREIALIRRYNEKADARFASGRDRVLFTNE